MNQTLAFFLHGAMRSDQDSFVITLSQLDSTSTGTTLLKRQQLNHSSHWYELQALLYFATGLDARSEYEVTFENVGVGKAFGVRDLELVRFVFCPSFFVTTGLFLPFQSKCS